MACFSSVIMTVLSASRNLLPFVSPYIDAINIVPYTEVMIVNLSLIKFKKVAGNIQQKLAVLKRLNTIAVGCVHLDCTYIIKEVHIKLFHRL